MEEPFLFRYKKLCSTKFVGSDNAFFDTKSDMVFVWENGATVLAIDSHGHGLPTTKKADIEKGDDQKDSIM